MENIKRKIQILEMFTHVQTVRERSTWLERRADKPALPARTRAQVGQDGSSGQPWGQHGHLLETMAGLPRT